MSDGSENENEATYLNLPEDVKHVVTERDFVSMLIDLYRNKPVLWKVKHPQYCDKIARTVAIQEIVQELQQFKPDFDEDKFKRKINTIRTNFNKQRNKAERAKAAGVTITTHLWYFNELLFLLDQDDEGTQENDDAAGNFAEDSNSVLNESNVTIEEEEELAAETEKKFVPTLSPVARTSGTRLFKKRPFPSRSNKNIVVKRRKVIEPQSEEGEKKEDRQEVDNSEDEKSEDPEQYMTITTTYYKKPKSKEDLLAEIWAKKLKKLSPTQKLYAEKIINDVLFEGELGNLSRNGVSFCPAFE